MCHINYYILLLLDIFYGGQPAENIKPAVTPQQQNNICAFPIFFTS